MEKKIVIHKEVMYFLSILMFDIAVPMTTTADLGISMVVSPAYLLSLKFSFLTFGQGEYIIQALFFIAFCIIMKKVKLTYFVSFLTVIIYGAILDFVRTVIPLYNPEITPPESLSMYFRIILLAVGMNITAAAVVFACRTYLPGQVYDFFAYGVSKKMNIPLSKFKTFFDFSFLIASFAMTMLFFGRIEGIGIGTIVMTTFNGILIGFYNKLLDRFFEVKTLFPKLEEKFEL